jgi:hypothetical protein
MADPAEAGLLAVLLLTAAPVTDLVDPGLIAALRRQLPLMLAIAFVLRPKIRAVRSRLAGALLCLRSRVRIRLPALATNTC